MRRNITKRDMMCQLLRESDYSIGDLAIEVDTSGTNAYRLIMGEIKKGNVEIVHHRQFGRDSTRYTWCGDDDLLTVAIRAADYLRDNAKDHLGQSLSRHLYRLTNAG